MIDCACADDVVAAFFDAIRRDARLPKTVRLQSFEADPIVHPAILRILASTGRYHEFSRTERPFADQFTGTKKSTRKKLRQLSAVGTVEIVNERTPAGAEAAFEMFLKLEAESWKGEEGTALLCYADDARFSRRLIENLAAYDLASVALLRIDGDAIAAQVLFYSGHRAYTWKTGFKASFARFSPGLLVADKSTKPHGIRSGHNNRFLFFSGWVHEPTVWQPKTVHRRINRPSPAQLIGLCGGSGTASRLSSASSTAEQASKPRLGSQGSCIHSLDDLK
jgi:hypothetical protein